MTPEQGTGHRPAATASDDVAERPAVHILDDGTVRIVDAVHGVVDVDAARLAAALRFSVPHLHDLLARFAPGRPPAPDIPLITLAALVARATTLSWTTATPPTSDRRPDRRGPS